MRVLISGGSGMIGTALTKSLLSKGNTVWVLTRNPKAAHLPEGATAVGWDGRTSAGWGELIGQMDAVVNLVRGTSLQMAVDKESEGAFLEQPGGRWASNGRGDPGGFHASQGAHPGLRSELLRAAY